MWTRDDYLEKRLDDQIDWLSKKSSANQKWYKRLKFLEILCAGLIPFCALVASDNQRSFTIAAALLGVLVALIAGVLALYQFQDQWLRYRATSEALRREKVLYLTQVGVYAGDDAFDNLVARAEEILAAENIQWKQAFMQPVPTGKAAKAGGGSSTAAEA